MTTVPSSASAVASPAAQADANALVVVHRVLMGAAAVALLFYLGVYVAYAANLIAFPFDYDQGEGFELVDAVMLSRGEWPYADIESYPFYGSIYPPVYHLLLVPFVWVFGAEYWYGRLFSFLTTLVSASAIGWAVYRKAGKTRAARQIALLAGLAFLSSNIVYHIGPLFRQHISMIMFETLAVVTLARVNEMADVRRRRRGLAVGFGLLILAGYTKQLAAFTAVAVLAFLFVRNPRRAMIWGSGFTAVGVAIFAYLTWSTGGHWWTQTITANVKDFIPAQAAGLFRLFIQLHFWLLLPAGLLMLYEIYFSRISIYTVWFVSATLFNGVSAGTWGAGDSYYATSVAALCVLSGIFLARMLNRDWVFNRNYLSRLLIDPWARFSRPLALMGMVIVPLIYLGYARSVLHLPTEGVVFEQVADLLNIEPNAQNGFYDSAGRQVGGYAAIGHFVTPADVQGGNRIVELIREIPPDVPVLSEEAAFSLITGRDVITNPVVLMILSWVGAFDSSELVGMIDRQEFGLVILRAQFYPTEVLSILSQRYESTEEIPMNGFTYIIMRPRTLEEGETS